MGKLVVIGGSRGIGNAILKEQLQSRECVNISRNAPEQAHDNLEHFNCDITSEELPDIDAVDALVYCPGSINLRGFSSLKEEDFKEDFEINVIGAIKAIKKYFRQLKKSDNASITMFSTVAVEQGMAFHASVAASKAAVEGLTRSLAAEFAPQIRVNCIAPTIVNTELAARILSNEKSKENLINKHPLKRILDPEDVAAMATYLLHARGVTGQVLGIDCGLSRLR